MKIMLQNQEVTFDLRVSGRAHGVYLKISVDEGLEVVIPRRYDTGRLPELLRRKERWILRNLEKISRQRRHRQLFSDGMSISILGQTKILRWSPRSELAMQNRRLETSLPKNGRAYIAETEDEIQLEGPMDVSSAQADLERYLRHKARDFFQERVAMFAAIMRTSFGRISVRAQKSRWGSCSRYNHLNFNWKLVLMPPEVIDYVIMHELAHTFQHNHSPRFYDVLAKFCPDYKKRRKILRELQESLPF